MHICLDKLEPVAALAVIENLGDTVHDPTLANRATHMGAIAFPGKKLISQTKDANLQSIDGENAPFPVRNFIDLRDKNFCHVHPLLKQCVR